MRQTSELISLNQTSIESGSTVEWTVEKNYKFRLSNFRAHLMEWLETNPSGEPDRSFYFLALTLLTGIVSRNSRPLSLDSPYCPSNRSTFRSIHISAKISSPLGRSCSVKSGTHHLCLGRCADQLPNGTRMARKNERWKSLGCRVVKRKWLASGCTGRGKGYRSVCTIVSLIFRSFAWSSR